MNIESKIAKITAERDECRAKSKKYADRAKELDDKLLDLENTSIVGMVRESGLTLPSLRSLSRFLRIIPQRL